jgi:hypothetical protein
MIEMRDNGPEAATIRAKANASAYRSIYLPLLRGVIPESLEAFDPADPTLVSGSRETTTVPAQSLYLLNSSFVRKQSLLLAERLLSENTATDPARIQNAYCLLLGRQATEKEAERALAFLADYESSHRALPVTDPKTPTAPKKTVAPKKSAEPPPDPDQIDQTGEPVVEEAVRPKDSRAAAWLAFTQALIGSAEFRFLR